jgi:hypothetical protein
MNKFLILGGLGRIGKECFRMLNSQYGLSNMYICDTKTKTDQFKSSSYTFTKDMIDRSFNIDSLSQTNLTKFIRDNEISHIINLVNFFKFSNISYYNEEIKDSMQLIDNLIKITNEFDKIKYFYLTYFSVFHPSSIIALKNLEDDKVNPLKEIEKKINGTNIRSIRFPFILSPYKSTNNWNYPFNYPTDLIYSYMNYDKENNEKKREQFNLTIEKDLTLNMIYIKRAIEIMVI